MTTRDEMTKAQRLELAAIEAPILRNASEKTLARRVALVDKDGKVTGYTSGREVLKGLAKVQELEHVVEDGKRPKTVVCKNCGKTVLVDGRGKVSMYCRGGCKRNCEICKAQVSYSSFRRWMKNRSKEMMCGKCSAKARDMTVTPERKTERAKKASEAAAETAREAARTRTKCKNGHEWTMQNKRPVKSGTGFKCRVCHCENERRARRARATTPSPTPKETHE